MFFDVFTHLCAQKGVSTYRACTDMGLNRSAVAKWKGGSTPNGSTLGKMAAYFGVSTDQLLGGTVGGLNPRDHRDIARDLEAFISDMDQGDLMFDGDPMSPQARESIIAAMKLGLEAAKVKNKERFTPKKYRKEIAKD